jgi:hypothetical protein
LILDTLTFCIALAVAIIATGVVDATAIIPVGGPRKSPVARRFRRPAGVPLDCR